MQSLHSQSCCTCPKRALPLPGVVRLSICSKVKNQSTFSPSSCSTDSRTFAGLLGSLHIAGHDSWLTLLAASCWHFSLVPLTLLLLSFLSCLKPSWQHCLSGLCPLAAGVVNPVPKRKPHALKCRSNKLALLWTKYSLFKIFKKENLFTKEQKTRKVYNS